MKDNEFENQDKRKSFFIKGCISIIAAAIFVIIGALFMLGALSVIYKVSPGRLLSGNSNISEKNIKEDTQADDGQNDQKEEIGKPQEKIDLPGLEEKIQEDAIRLRSGTLPLKKSSEQEPEQENQEPVENGEDNG